jgi:hypothetical protein
MNPSNKHPGTAARGLRRTFVLLAASGLLTALLAAPGPALAQGLIEFSVGASTYTRYQVWDNGTGLRTLPFPQVPYELIHVTTQSYLGVGRLYLYPQADAQSNYNLWVWSEATGTSWPVTNFNNGVQTNNNWSSDSLDSFFSFTLVNNATGQTSLYRANVSAADIASSTFTPITVNDLGTPRVTYVTDWPNYVTYWWSHDGSSFYYVDPSNTTKIRVRAVGAGVPFGTDPIVFIAPTSLSVPRVGPPVDPMNPDRYVVAWSAGTGILAMDLVTSKWWWLATQTSTGLSSLRGPAFSPDGSTIAFGAIRTAKGASYPGVYAVPFGGGPLTKVTELPGSKSPGHVLVNNWNTGP